MYILLAFLLLQLALCFPQHNFIKSLEDDDGEQKSAYDKIIEVNNGHKDLFEADIHIEPFPENIKTPYSNVKSKILKRGLRREHEYLWVERVIPYELTKDVEYGREIIESALREIEEQSCIKFKEHENEKHWIQILDEGACFSGVGRAFWREGSQKLSLARGCMQKGTIMHEVLHSLGFWHEQSRPDRDKYVEIYWENVQEGEEHNFAKYSTTQLDSQQVNYDIHSIMHYGKYSFSKNGEPTILAIDDRNQALGQRVGLSREDAVQLNLLYKCQDVGQVYTSWSEWGPCDSDFHCKSSRQRFCSARDSTRCPEASEYGVHTDYRTCPNEECFRPIDGHWSRWSAWTSCDKTCGTGKKSRGRTCDDPKQKHGGKYCAGEESLQTTDCITIPCGLDPDDCQFDNQGMCFWKDVSSISYQWERRKGKTPSANTGPDQDHSTGQGFYLFAESSAPAETGMKANLLSKIFPASKGRCMTFFYCMHGANMGSMRVFSIVEGSDENKLLWEKSGPQGEGWNMKKITIQSEYSYRIKFQAERGASFLGDMALDDIQFKDGQCGDGAIHFKTLLPVTATPTTPIKTQAPINGICNMAVKPLGCFAEITHQPALSIILDNHRGPGNAYHGKQLAWDKFPESLNSLLCDCLHIAKSRGIKYIGLRYFGECWGIEDDGRHQYNQYGISTLCVDGAYQPCYHQNYNDVCVGKAMTNYVYEVL